MDDHERQFQRLYADVFARVREVVNEGDPEGLLALGAPVDEYDDAVAYLTRRLLHHDLPDRAEIEAWFGTQYGVTPSGVDRLLEPLRLMTGELPKR
jgi:hypothetical protein